MSISKLSQETVEDLCAALEKGRTMDWKVLMRRSFHTIYSEDDVAMIESSKDLHPAKVLLDDLSHRDITLQELVDGLRAIGNKKAVSIIMKGAQKSGLDIQHSGSRAPPQVPHFSTARPQEFKNVSCVQRKEQSETLPFPVQETEATEATGHPSDPGHEAQINLVEDIVSKFSACFSFYYKTS